MDSNKMFKGKKKYAQEIRAGYNVNPDGKGVQFKLILWLTA